MLGHAYEIAAATVEWNADEGSTFGWEEVYCGSARKELRAVVEQYLDEYSGSVAQVLKKTSGLLTTLGPLASRPLKPPRLGASTFLQIRPFDDREAGVEIWQVGDGSLVVARQLDGEALGSFSGLDADPVTDPVLRHHVPPLFLPAGSEEGQEEAW